MTLHFKSKEAFRKYNAYRFIHEVNEGGHERVEIAGHPHHVEHELVSNIHGHSGVLKARIREDMKRLIK
jgi:hypothetical protein